MGSMLKFQIQVELKERKWTFTVDNEPGKAVIEVERYSGIRIPGTYDADELRCLADTMLQVARSIDAFTPEHVKDIEAARDAFETIRELNDKGK